MLDNLTIAAITAAAGAAGWSCRDDDTERIAGINFTSSTWKAILSSCAAVMIWMQAPSPIAAAIAGALFIYTLTGPHNLALSPPGAFPLPKPRDLIQRAIFAAFDAVPGDALTPAMYVVASILRYALPVTLMGWALDNLYLVYAGPLTSIVYYPWIHNETSKYVRAVACIGLIFGALACGV